MSRSSWSFVPCETIDGVRRRRHRHHFAAPPLAAPPPLERLALPRWLALLAALPPPLTPSNAPPPLPRSTTASCGFRCLAPVHRRVLAAPLAVAAPAASLAVDFVAAAPAVRCFVAALAAPVVALAAVHLGSRHCRCDRVRLACLNLLARRRLVIALLAVWLLYFCRLMLLLIFMF